MKIYNGAARFEFYLAQIEAQMNIASNEKNPALWLYTNNIRTPLFMLEGLAKLYSGIHNKNKFNKIKESAKALEDAVGAVDYYDNMSKDFVKDVSIPPGVVQYLQAQTREKLQRVNDILEEAAWLNSTDRIRKIRGKLAKADWQNAKDEVKGIYVFYQKSIAEIKDFMIGDGALFTELENQVHAMRRKLRWLSIYPQALQGVIQLTDDGLTDENTTKYLIPEITESSFNKMPDAGTNSYFILFEKKYFYALSWIIAELGRIKDEGLRIIACAEAFQQTETLDHDNAVLKASQLIGHDENALQYILDKATTVCKTWFQEENIDKIIKGISAIKR